MAQNTIDFSADMTGVELLDSYLSPLQNNALTSNSGTSRPSYAQAGTVWLDTTTSPWVMKMFNGVSDIVIGSLDGAALTFNPSGNPKVKDNFTATAAPTTSDNASAGYSNGSRWYYDGDLWICVSASGSAVWVDTGLQLGDLGALAVLNTVGTSQITDKAVTLAKIQDIAQNTFLGRITSGSGVASALSVSDMQSALGIADTMLSYQTASASSFLTFDFLSTTYKYYELDLTGIRPSADADLLVQFRDSSGYFTSSTDYGYSRQIVTNGVAAGGSSSGSSSIVPITSVLASASNGVTGKMSFGQQGSRRMGCEFSLGTSNEAATTIKHSTGFGMLKSSSNPITGVRISFSGGATINEGSALLRGVRA